MTQPIGAITVYGEKQLENLVSALEVACTAREAYVKTIEKNDAKTDEDLHVTIRPVTHKAYRVEISGIIEFDEED